MENADLYNVLNNFKTKTEAYKYFGLSGNSNSIIKLKNVADSIGFDLNLYAERRRPSQKFCKQCNKDLKRNQNKFCSSSCAARFNNKNRNVSEKTRKKISEKLYGKPHLCKNRIKKNKIKLCKVCGQEKCANKEICHHTKKWFYNLVPFSFDINTLGTIDACREYYRIKDLILKEYFDNELSPKDIKIKYQYDKNFENILHILKSFGVKTRNLSESEINACLNGKLKTNINNINSKHQYTHGWHITWNEKKIYYRSSYELEFAQKLDDEKIDYETEYFRIKYWDSQKLKYRVAIPDFFMFSENKIVEIKSRITFNKQNVIDKFKEYVKLGFCVSLMYEKKEYCFDEICSIEECDFIY